MSLTEEFAHLPQDTEDVPPIFEDTENVPPVDATEDAKTPAGFNKGSNPLFDDSMEMDAGMTSEEGSYGDDAVRRPTKTMNFVHTIVRRCNAREGDDENPRRLSGATRGACDETTTGVFGTRHAAHRSTGTRATVVWPGPSSFVVSSGAVAQGGARVPRPR